MTDRWMTYAEAATALGMTAESVRQRARREHWRRQIGNGGKALILVPGDTAPTGRDTDGDTSETPPAPRPAKRPEPDTAIIALQAQIAAMETRAVELRADLERERGERVSERVRADGLTEQVTDLARQLARVIEEAAGRERELHARIAAGDAARIADHSRPWWRRLVG